MGSPSVGKETDETREPEVRGWVRLEMNWDTVLVGEVKTAASKIRITKNCTAYCGNKLVERMIALGE